MMTVPVHLHGSSRGFNTDESVVTVEPPMLITITIMESAVSAAVFMIVVRGDRCRRRSSFSRVSGRVRFGADLTALPTRRSFLQSVVITLSCSSPRVSRCGGGGGGGCRCSPDCSS